MSRAAAYPVECSPDNNGTILVTFVDLPCATFGDTEAEALENAKDALRVVLEAYLRDGRKIPQPSPPMGRRTVQPNRL